MNDGKDEEIENDAEVMVSSQTPADDFLLTRFFNWMGDQFAKMVGGIIHFVPRFFRAIFRWLISEKLRNLIKAVVRAVVWMCVWVIVVFGLYLVFDYEWVMSLMMDVLAFLQKNFAWLIKILKMNAKEIWTTLALIGSLYGLIYGTVRWWRRKKAAKTAERERGEPK